MKEKIEVGFEALTSDGGEEFGAVREVARNGRPELVVYVENARDFSVPARSGRSGAFGEDYRQLC